tara:strand:+ start:1769 stop:2845 length:1077 start_codon:yes stop_codon:yes gene_type:complete
MKIIHVINSLDQGGAEMTLIRLINNSSQKHFIITILNSHSLIKKLKKPVEIISLLPLSLKKIKLIKEKIKNYSPDIFQGWMYHGDLIASILGFIYNKKILWNIRHGKISLKHTSKKTIILRLLLSILSHFIPTKIISCSKEGQSVHKNIGYCGHKITVIRNGITQAYEKKDSDLDLSRKKDLVIASIGRDNPQKNRTYFIKIIKELSKEFNVKAIIVGRGATSSKEIKNELSKNQIDLRLYESFENIYKVFQKIDILILTSSYGEGCPNILIESLQSKLLCFSTDVGDAKYILDSKDLLIPNNDPIESKKIISKLIKNPIKMNYLLKKNNTRSLKLFAPELMVKKYENVWRNSMKNIF